MKKESVMDIIKKRRSVRSYLDSPVENEKIEKVIESARLAPSACNSQCWRFIVVRDKEVLKQLVENGLEKLPVKNKWAKTAPVIIVACAELNFIPHRLGAKISGIDYYLLDMGCAIEHLILTAAELGLGTCWIGWFKEKFIRRLLKIPSSMKIVALITLGYPEEKLKEKEKKRHPLEEILFYDRHGNTRP